MNSRIQYCGVIIGMALMLSFGGPAFNLAPAFGAPLMSSASTSVLASGLEGPLGSTIGPDGALYVAQGTTGSIARVDPRTGQITTFAAGLPQMIQAIGLGGPTDVAFVGRTMYVLVTLVSKDVGGNAIDGIYRFDGSNHFTVIADIGTFNIQNPPTISFPISVASGLLFAMEPYRDGFLVTDGHLNRMLSVRFDGKIKILMAFDDIVPTGLTTLGKTIFMAEAGPVPHQPQDGKVVAFRAHSQTTQEIASGASLLVGVNFACDGQLYALSQGPGVPGAPAGSPAQPNSGALVRANSDGTFSFLVDNLNLPASFNFIGSTAYVVTLGGDVLKINGALGHCNDHKRH